MCVYKLWRTQSLEKRKYFSKLTYQADGPWTEIQEAAQQVKSSEPMNLTEQHLKEGRGQSSIKELLAGGRRFSEGEGGVGLEGRREWEGRQQGEQWRGREGRMKQVALPPLLPTHWHHVALVYCLLCVCVRARTGICGLGCHFTLLLVHNDCLGNCPRVLYPLCECVYVCVCVSVCVHAPGCFGVCLWQHKITPEEVWVKLSILLT